MLRSYRSALGGTSVGLTLVVSYSISFLKTQSCLSTMIIISFNNGVSYLWSLSLKEQQDLITS